MTPLRVLQVVSNMNSGGIENMLMNLYREIDRTKVQFDFLLHTQEKCVFEDEILELGGRILRISPLRLHSIKNYLEEVDQIFRNNNYLIVHSHISVWSYFVLRVAKKIIFRFELRIRMSLMNLFGIIKCNVFRLYFY